MTITRSNKSISTMIYVFISVLAVTLQSWNVMILGSALAFQPSPAGSGTTRGRCRNVASRPVFSPCSHLGHRGGYLTTIVRAQTGEKAMDGSEPDLFEYFDPLLSPHAYPDGVSPSKKPTSQTNDDIRKEQKLPQPRRMPFGIDYYSLVGDDDKAAVTLSGQDERRNIASSPVGTSNDLFEYFDPLLSPHSYPGGISPTAKPKELQVVAGTTEEVGTASSSPIASNTGTIRRSKIGILLMDHGSRNEASNARLKALANLYQLTLSVSDSAIVEGQGDNDDVGHEFVVEAAHMEIASPSIPDGLQTLLQAGVDEIVCHPYFLSPGRHVREDIPKIVDEAIESMRISIPVITTAPVGSNTQLMLGAIHSLVRENSVLLNKNAKS